MNITFTPFGWEERIREGQFAGQLLRPVHPIHYDIADIAGWKIVSIVLWLPIAVVLSWLFHPNLHPTGLEIVVFSVAIWGAYLIRTMNTWILGMLAFWSTRVTAIFEAYFVVELLLSGRLVPMQLMPVWVQDLANLLPFKWTFGYPIESLTGGLPAAQLVGGLGDAGALDDAGRARCRRRLAQSGPALRLGGELTMASRMGARRRFEPLRPFRIAWLLLPRSGR